MAIKINLTDEEYNVLNHITNATKTDCWFALEVDKDGNDYVYDLEEDCELTMQDALSQLHGAVAWMTLDDWKKLGVATREIVVFVELLQKFEIILRGVI